MPRMQDEEKIFPPDMRELAKEANLPIPSWHVGRMYHNGHGNGGQSKGDGNQGAGQSDPGGASSTAARSLFSALGSFLANIHLPHLTLRQRF